MDWTMDRTLLPPLAYISLSWLSPCAHVGLYIPATRSRVAIPREV